MNDLRYWLWFVMAFYPGNQRIWELITPYRDVRKAYDAVCDGTHPSLSDSERKKASATHIEQCDSIIEYCGRKGYRIITFGDENYPPLLRNIYNPPAVLFCMGNIENFNSMPALACVGTRTPSIYSIEITERICGELAKRGLAVVSGFAVGLDSAAHRGVLKQKGGCTAAVLAGGLDYDYPRENAKWKEQIAVNGAVITEYLPGAHPTKDCFQLRNRIISGMCFGTLVTEAAYGSGSLITADHAVDQGRMLFCIPPGDIFDKRYSGVVKYLRDGAICAFSHLDILYEYYTGTSFKVKDDTIRWPELYDDSDILTRDSRGPVKKRRTKRDNKDKAEESGEAAEKTAASPVPASSPDMVWEELFDELDDRQQAIVTCLKDTARHLDEICEMTGIDSFAAMASVTELEMLGAIELLPDRRYKLL